MILWQFLWALVLSCHTFCVLCCFSTNYPDHLLWMLRSALNWFSREVLKDKTTWHNAQQETNETIWQVLYPFFFRYPWYTCSLMICACAEMFPDCFPLGDLIGFWSFCVGLRMMNLRRGAAVLFFPEPAPLNVHPNCRCMVKNTIEFINKYLRFFKNFLWWLFGTQKSAHWMINHMRNHVQVTF